jgi:hypothetical protein
MQRIDDPGLAAYCRNGASNDVHRDSTDNDVVDEDEGVDLCLDLPDDFMENDRDGQVCVTLIHMAGESAPARR